MNPPHHRPPVVKAQRLWYLPLLTLIVLLLGLLTIYNLAKIGGVESANRDVICDTRALREQYPPVTPIEKALLEQARNDKTTCPQHGH